VSSTLAPTSARCIVPGCSARIPIGRRMCVDCWRSVPLPVRERVWATYRAHVDPVGYVTEGTAYVAAWHAAIESVARP
jgi:hypothetical protein